MPPKVMAIPKNETGKLYTDIQTAINACAVEGGTVFFLPGNYYLSNVTVPPEVILAQEPSRIVWEEEV